MMREPADPDSPASSSLERSLQVARSSARRLPIGTELSPDGGADVRIWAPRCKSLAIVLDGRDPVPLTPEPDGYYAGHLADAAAGMRYGFKTDHTEKLLPDPASRFQPEGPHGLSEIVDPTAFSWSDRDWRGVRTEKLVVYEMHIGTFTPEGDWNGAARELAALAELGITCIEIMPIAEFPGRFGWGYDGVNLFAPFHVYGRPDDFRSFVDQAHAAGIAVILDVVYNHFGPDGNYLNCFSRSYFSDRYENEWGDPINFDGPDSVPVREFFIANAGHWIEEYHLDGLRLDATQQIFDASTPNIMAEITARVRQAAGDRASFVVGENEPQDSRLVRAAGDGGFGLDALWNDDLHHSAIVALTGHNEAYYTDYLGRPQEFVSAAKYGFLYQGQHYKWQRNGRGSPSLDLAAENFVVYLQNHDQVANSGTGERIGRLTSPGRLRAMTAYVLLMPGIPMLFQGQEFGASTPFFYFADHEPELAAQIREGRATFLEQFRSLATVEMQARIADPGAESTYRRTVLDFAERERHAHILGLHRDLLALRRDDPVLAARPARIDGAVLGTECWMLRFLTRNGSDRLLIVNLGSDLRLDPAPEPLLGPVADAGWSVIWSSEAPAYGGLGTAPVYSRENWRIPGGAAILLGPGAALPHCPVPKKKPKEPLRG